MMIVTPKSMSGCFGEAFANFHYMRYAQELIEEDLQVLFEREPKLFYDEHVQQKINERLRPLLDKLCRPCITFSILVNV